MQRRTPPAAAAAPRRRCSSAAPPRRAVWDFLGRVPRERAPRSRVSSLRVPLPVSRVSRGFSESRVVSCARLRRVSGVAGLAGSLGPPPAARRPPQAAAALCSIRCRRAPAAPAAAEDGGAKRAGGGAPARQRRRTSPADETPSAPAPVAADIEDVPALRQPLPQRHLAACSRQRCPATRSPTGAEVRGGRGRRRRRRRRDGCVQCVARCCRPVRRKPPPSAVARRRTSVGCKHGAGLRPRRRRDRTHTASAPVAPTGGGAAAAPGERCRRRRLRARRDAVALRQDLRVLSRRRPPRRRATGRRRRRPREGGGTRTSRRWVRRVGGGGVRRRRRRPPPQRTAAVRRARGDGRRATAAEAVPAAAVGGREGAAPTPVSSCVARRAASSGCSLRDATLRGEPSSARPHCRLRRYGVWVSEVMLQQTRGETVITYWLRFIRRFHMAALAAASPRRERGVGGPRILSPGAHDARGRQRGACSSAPARPPPRPRARAPAPRCSRASLAMTGAASATARRDAGRRYDAAARAEALRGVRGIGAYTAGAIASIAQGEVEPAVDGNVILSRLLAVAAPPGDRALGEAVLDARQGAVRAVRGRRGAAWAPRRAAAPPPPHAQSPRRSPLRRSSSTERDPAGVDAGADGARRDAVHPEGGGVRRLPPRRALRREGAGRRRAARERRRARARHRARRRRGGGTPRRVALRDLRARSALEPAAARSVLRFPLPKPKKAPKRDVVRGEAAASSAWRAPARARALVRSPRRARAMLAPSTPSRAMLARSNPARAQCWRAQPRAQRWCFHARSRASAAGRRVRRVRRPAVPDAASPRDRVARVAVGVRGQARHAALLKAKAAPRGAAAARRARARGGARRRAGGAGARRRARGGAPHGAVRVRGRVHARLLAPAPPHARRAGRAAGRRRWRQPRRRRGGWRGCALADARANGRGGRDGVDDQAARHGAGGGGAAAAAAARGAGERAGR